MTRRRPIDALCESCGHRPRGAGGKLSRCLECLASLVQRDRRLRAERATLRQDRLIRARLVAKHRSHRPWQLKVHRSNRCSSAKEVGREAQTIAALTVPYMKRCVASSINTKSHQSALQQ